MTYLELCQSLAKETGFSPDLTKPTTVIGQTGEELAIVEWVAQAWTDIQTARGTWKFMWADDFTKDTVVGQSLLDTSSDNVGRFDTDTFTSYEKAVGTSDRTYLHYELWDDVKKYIKSIDSANQQPSIITRKPDGNLSLVYPADKIYTIEADYYRRAQLFTANADVPTGLPVEYHMAIVYKALFDYGAFQDAVEQMKRSEIRYKQELLQNMLWDQQEEGDMTVTPE